VVASLPCYGQDNVDKQRGRGVFERSIEVSPLTCSNCCWIAWRIGTALAAAPADSCCCRACAC
jgi:hypothetical protein